MLIYPDKSPEVAMAIRFRCDGCGKPFEVRDELAGKTAQCKMCGGRIQIPDRRVEEPEPVPGPDLDIYGLDDPEPRSPEPEPVALSRGKGGWATRPISDGEPRRAPASSYPDPPKAKKSSGFSFFGDGGIKGTVGVLFMLLVIGFRVYRAHHRFQARNPQPQAFQGDFQQPQPASIPLDGPITLPNFPDSGPAREIEPGVSVREVDFGPPTADPNAVPGHSGKLWIYTPTGDHPARSLPCVMIAGAGSNLITGMTLGDGARPEHLPYVRAGFAVVAYELDGFVEGMAAASEEEIRRATSRFLRARAGLVNAHIALEYALAKVPEIDPGRIVAAGHSSAGTMAVLFAEHEPRLRACVAFAPALDFEDRFGPQGVAGLRQIGLGPILDRFAPRVAMSSLGCPLFLFHARDDGNVPVEQSQKFAADLRSQGKPITLEIVPRGDHDDAMIRQGIPRAIGWLRKTLGPGPRADAVGWLRKTLGPGPGAEAAGPG
jgi:dienelactone hydrolase/DNA-directed RNA polymerase subunit RPC12/RpoP